MITISDINKLKSGDKIYHTKYLNADGTAFHYKITSIKTWKTRPTEFLLGLKRGLFDYAKITEEKAAEWSVKPLPQVKPVPKNRIRS